MAETDQDEVSPQESPPRMTSSSSSSRVLRRIWSTATTVKDRVLPKKKKEKAGDGPQSQEGARQGQGGSGGRVDQQPLLPAGQGQQVRIEEGSRAGASDLIEANRRLVEENIQLKKEKDDLGEEIRRLKQENEAQAMKIRRFESFRDSKEEEEGRVRREEVEGLRREEVEGLRREEVEGLRREEEERVRREEEMERRREEADDERRRANADASGLVALPEDVIHEIFSYCVPQSYNALALTSRRFSQLIKHRPEKGLRIVRDIVFNYTGHVSIRFTVPKEHSLLFRHSMEGLRFWSRNLRAVTQDDDTGGVRVFTTSTLLSVDVLEENMPDLVRGMKSKVETVTVNDSQYGYHDAVFETPDEQRDKFRSIVLPALKYSKLTLNGNEYHSR